MHAGFGKIEITPPLGVELAGYGYYLGRRAERVEDPLFVRAAALEENGETFLIVSCDCLGLSREIVGAVEAGLSQAAGIPADHVMIVSIHTHTGPAMKYHGGCGQVDEAYTAGVADKILSACHLALADKKIVEQLCFVCQPLEKPIAYNRAFAGNPVDGKARFFVLRRQGGLPMVLSSYACHAVCQGNVRFISADYPGRVCALLDGAPALSMYLNGACGDIDPIRCNMEERPKRLKEFAETVAAALEKGEANALPPTVSGGEIKASLRLAPLSREDIHALADRANQRETEPPGGGRVARAWEEEMIRNYEPDRREEAFCARYVALGGVPIIALPFETYTLTGMLIRQETGDERGLVLGCAGEMMGYLPTMDDYGRHSYASQDAFFLYRRIPTLPGEAERLGHEIGQKLAAAMKREKQP